MIELRVAGRPALLNAERSRHWREHREMTAVYRRLAALQWGRRGAIPWERVEVESWPEYRSNRSWPDVGAWLPSTKAVIDGCVDAGALPGDGPGVVGRLVFSAPLRGSEDALVVIFRPWTPPVPRGTIERMNGTAEGGR